MEENLNNMSDMEIIQDLTSNDSQVLLTDSCVTKDEKFIRALLDRLKYIDMDLYRQTAYTINSAIIKQITNSADTTIDYLARTKDVSFPVEALPANIKNYILEVAENLQVSVDMVAVTALEVFSTSLQGRFNVNIKSGWNEPLNLFCAIIASPSERKSPVVNLLRKPIIEFEKEENERLKPQITKSRLTKEALEAKKAKLIKKDTVNLDELSNELLNFKEIKPVKIFADDVTSEKLTSLLSENNNVMSVISCEGGIFETMAGKYSQNNINIDVFLKGYSGDTLKVDRVNRDSEIIENPRLGMLLAIQPIILEEIIRNQQFSGRGLLARFLYCFPSSLVGKRKFKTNDVSKALQEQYDNIVKRGLRIEIGKEKTIYFNDEAKETLENFYNEIESKSATEYESIADWCGKLLGNTSRIAGILALINNVETNTISSKDVENAILIARYFLQNTINIFQLSSFSQNIKDANYILDFIIKKNIYLFKTRELIRGRRSFHLTEDASNGLDELMKRNYLFYDEETKTYFVNPALYENSHGVT